MKIKWNIRSLEDTSFAQFNDGVATFTELKLAIDDFSVDLKEISTAELTIRYQIMIPSRILRLATKDKLITIGAINKIDLSEISIEYESNVIKSFWNIEFVILVAAILLLTHFI